MADIDTSAVRRWARENGLPVGERGRIRPEILAQYIAAHDGKLPPPIPEKAAPVEEKDLVARPLASPGVAESYGDDALAIARKYVPGADRQDLTNEMVNKARHAGAAIVGVGSALKLYRDTPPPDGAPILLDFRVNHGQ